MANAAVTSNIKRWKEGNIYFAENTFVKMAYAVTFDKAKVGTIGIKDDVFVEYISEHQGRLWEAECRQS